MEASYIYSRAAYLGLVGPVWVGRGFVFAGRLGEVKLGQVQSRAFNVWYTVFSYGSIGNETLVLRLEELKSVFHT
jgi:hypothetical protein